MSIDAAALRVLAEQMRNPDAGDQDLVVDGQPWRVRRQPHPGIKLAVSMGAEGTPPIITVFEPSDTPHSGYSAALPFLPNAEAAVTAVPGTEAITVMWGSLPDAAAAIRELEASSIADGWSASEEAAAPLQSMGMVELRREGQRRLLTRFPGAGGVMLTQGPVRDRNRQVT
jgi:hypothetical protein